MKLKIETNTIVIITLIIGVIIGYYFGLTFHGHDDEITSNQNTMTHSHEKINTTNPSSVSFEVFEDPKSGYNINIETQNFTFSPQNASLEHIDGQGHAHLYINDVKIQRIYGNWIHIENLDEGENEIRIVLNSNNHKELVYNDSTIEEIETIIVS